ncbi:hypothetical protein NW760_002835 [Fusarium oxysporum]|nr:hypothetical protein NW760_002835 [Fusarium oxysporum]
MQRPGSGTWARQEPSLEDNMHEVHVTTERNTDTRIYKVSHPRRLALPPSLILALAVAFISIRPLVLTAIGSLLDPYRGSPYNRTYKL